MSEEKSYSFYTSFKKYIKGIALINKISPGIIEKQFLSLVFKNVMPYISFFFISLLLQQATSGAGRKTIFITAITAIAVEAAVYFLDVYFTRKFTEMDEMFFLRKDFFISDIFMKMKLVDFDDPHVHEKLKRIRELERLGGLGLEIILPINDSFFGGLISVLIGLFLSIGAFTYKISNPRFEVLNSPFVSVGLFAFIILNSLFLFILIKKVESYWQKNFEGGNEANRLYSYAFEIPFENSKALDIRLFKQFEIFKRYMTMPNTFSIGSNLHKSAKGPMGAYIVAQRFCVVSTMAVIYAFLAIKTYAGAFNIALFTRYAGSLVTMATGLNSMLKILGRLAVSSPIMQMTFDLITLSKDVETINADSCENPSIIVDKASFKYPNSKFDSLKEVSVKLENNKRYALVGKNGSGKTTFVKLITGLYAPYSGSVKINGYEASSLNLNSRSDLFSAIFQDFGIPNFTVGEIVSGGDEFCEERIISAVEKSGLNLSKLPLGLNTYVDKGISEDGVNLSGGERQKLAIARALYHPGKILIMDEPTAALDPEAESEIYENLSRIVDNRLTVYVSHRLSSCKFCDIILVFDDGRIVESGTHQELLEQKGLYSELWEAQAHHYR